MVVPNSRKLKGKKKVKQVHEIPTIPIWYQRLISYCTSLFMTFWYHLNPREAKVNAHSWQIKKNLRFMEVHKPLTLPLKGIPQPRKVCECALSKHSHNLHIERDYQAWTPPAPLFLFHSSCVSAHSYTTIFGSTVCLSHLTCLWWNRSYMRGLLLW